MDLSYLELEGQGQGIIMEVTRPLFLGQFHLVKWPITPNKSAGSVLWEEHKIWKNSGRFFQFFLAFSGDLNFNGNCHVPLGLNFMKGLKSINEHFGIRSHRCHLSFFELKNKLTHLLIRRDHRVNGNCLCLIDHYPTVHSSLVDYLAQVIKEKNCPTTFYCIFQLV